MFSIRLFREIKYTFLHNVLCTKKVRFMNEPFNLDSVAKFVTCYS
jgi:hypothetical protein